MALLIFFLSNSRKQTPDFPTNLISVLQKGVYVQNLEQLRAVEEVRMKLGAAELRRQAKENMEALEQNDVKSDDDDEEIESALNGFNSTIFAYGQTASGHTHTMLGSKVDPGIMRHAVDHIFDAIEQTPVREEQNDEKSDDEEMPELVTDSDDNDNAENEASNPVLELEIAEMKDQIDEEIKKIQALTAKEFIFKENTPFVPSNPMEIPPGLAYLQKYADPYVQDHANEEPIDNSSGPPTSNFDFPTELVMLDDYNTVRRGDVVYANLSNQTADGW